MPHMLDNDYTPYSAVDIFVKDLVCMSNLNLYMLLATIIILQILVPCLLQGIVSHESSNSRIPVHVSCIAHQLFISGCFSVINKDLSFDSVFLFQILAFTIKIS